MRFLGRPLLWLLAAAVGLAVLLMPGVASAEGPGYGGSADQLAVKWKFKDRSKDSEKASDLVVYGVGFRAGSTVLLRIGDGMDLSVLADETGTLRATFEPQRAEYQGMRLAAQTTLTTGTTIFAAGQTPGGTTLTLVGFVPSPVTSETQTPLSGWTLPALGILALLGLLAPQVPRRAQVGQHGRGVAGVHSRGFLAGHGPSCVGTHRRGFLSGYGRGVLGVHRAGSAARAGFAAYTAFAPRAGFGAGSATA